MTTDSSPLRRRGAWPARLLALVPIVLLVAAAAAFVSSGNSITGLIGDGPPPPDELDLRRVEFHPGEIRVLVRNPQPDDLTIATVTVDDAIVPYTLDGPRTLGRLRSTTVEVPFDWVQDDPYTVGVTTSTGIQTVADVPAAVETPGASGSSVGGYALIGFLVGVVPIALGMPWLPALRQADARWLTAFMALTAGLLTFLAFDALAEALELQAALPSALGGTGLVLLGVAVSYLGLSWVAHRLSSRDPAAAGGRAAGRRRPGDDGRHRDRPAQPRRGPGDRLVVRRRGARARNVPRGRLHGAQRHRGPRHRDADRRAGRVGLGRLAVLALVAGAPAIAGAWIGGFLTNEVLAVLFFSIAVGAALQVVVEVGRYVARRSPGGLGSGWVVGGFLAGIAIMYLTGLIAG